MSAVSIFVRGSIGYLLTDAGFFSDDGAIVALEPKVAISARCPAAIAVSGRLRCGVTVETITAWLADQRDLRAIISGLPALALELDRLNVANDPGVDERLGAGMVRLHGIGFSPIDQQAHGFKITSRPDAFIPSQPAGVVREVENSVMPPADRSLCQMIGSNPVAYGRAIFEQQRLDTVDYGYHCVGGWGDVTTVSAAGVTTETVVRWPDRIGKRITL